MTGRQRRQTESKQADAEDDQSQQPDGRVRCELCAYRCIIRPGSRGICQVRENRDGTLYTLVYDTTNDVPDGSPRPSPPLTP